MVSVSIDDYLRLVPALKESPQNSVWLTYDPEGDVLYINYERPGVATDSELTDDDIIVRYKGDEIIGLTVLHVTQR